MLAHVTQKPTMMACEPTSTTAICRVVLARQKQQSTPPNREQKCADAIGTVPVPWTDHYQ